MFSKTISTAADNWINLHHDVKSLGGTVTKNGMYLTSSSNFSWTAIISMPSSEDYLALKLKYNLYE